MSWIVVTKMNTAEKICGQQKRKINIEINKMEMENNIKFKVKSGEIK